MAMGSLFLCRRQRLFSTCSQWDTRIKTKPLSPRPMLLEQMHSLLLMCANCLRWRTKTTTQHLVSTALLLPLASISGWVWFHTAAPSHAWVLVFIDKHRCLPALLACMLLGITCLGFASERFFMFAERAVLVGQWYSEYVNSVSMLSAAALSTRKHRGCTGRCAHAV